MENKKNNTRGGKRIGAGRPKGGSLYGEPTKPIRVPLSKVLVVMEWLKNYEKTEKNQKPGKVISMSNENFEIYKSIAKMRTTENTKQDKFLEKILIEFSKEYGKECK